MAVPPRSPPRPAGLPSSTPADVGDRFVALCDVMAALRSDAGCPWDREQTLHSLRPYLIEESHEVVDALDALSPSGEGPAEAHRSELGDLLLQIVFQAQIQREENRFDAGGVCDAITEKMLRRHPHIFAPDGAILPLKGRAPAPDWESLKAAERKERGEEEGGALDGVPRSLPALARSMRSGERANRVGFDWPDHRGVVDKIEEEIGEVKVALEDDDNAAVEAEIGDLLYAIVNLCRHRKIDPETALHGTIDRFQSRFSEVESGLRDDGKTSQECSLEELERRWQAAKVKLRATET